MDDDIRVGTAEYTAVGVEDGIREGFEVGEKDENEDGLNVGAETD